MYSITTFKWVPPFAQGFVRDIRLRWACEEAGFPYQMIYVGFSEVASHEYRLRQPFSQVPVLQDGSLSLFESGSILLHLGERSEKLLPLGEAQRKRATTWVFAAMNSIEPHVQFFNMLRPEDRLYPEVREKLTKRLQSLSEWLEGREYFEGDQFTIADLLMTCVLRELLASGILREFPKLDQYVARGLARPAFKKSLADQLKVHAENAPPSH